MLPTRPALTVSGHSTGLPTHNFAIDETITTKDWFYLLGKLAPNVPFRSLFQYSNLNYAAAGYIVEYLTGRDLFEVVREKVFAPLDLEGNTDLREAIASGTFANGFINMGINATECAIDTEAATSAQTMEASTTGDTPQNQNEPGPASCYGRLEAIEKWSQGDKGHDYGGGGAYNLKATDLVRRPAFHSHFRMSISFADCFPAEMGPGNDPCGWDLAKHHRHCRHTSIPLVERLAVQHGLVHRRQGWAPDGVPRRLGFSTLFNLWSDPR